MSKIFLIAIFFVPGGEHYRDLVRPFDTVAQCEAVKKELAEQAKSIAGAGFNARCVEVQYGSSF